MDDYKHIPQAGDAVTCASCGAVVGFLVAITPTNQLWLNVGGVELRYAHGRCGQCLRIWHFNSSDYLLNRY